MEYNDFMEDLFYDEEDPEEIERKLAMFGLNDAEVDDEDWDDEDWDDDDDW